MSDIKSIRVLLTGGGSGGHVYPLIAVAEELRKLATEQRFALDIVYLGPTDAYTAILKEAKIETRSMVVGKLRRYFSLQNILDIPKFLFSIISAFFEVFWLMPDVIFSKGGTGAFPVVVAGWFYQIPIIIHESDAVPGMNNALSARFASRIAVSFDRTVELFGSSKAAFIGTPVRREFMLYKPNPEEAKKELGFDPKLPLLLVLGGSQGSQPVNEFIVANLEAIIKDVQILHQTGVSNFQEIEKLSKVALANIPTAARLNARYIPLPYLTENMKTALAAADVVLARAGANTIAEISAFGKPAILVPLQGSANDHQRINAYEFAKTGAALVIEQSNLLPGVFLSQLHQVLGNEAILKRMSLASGQYFRPQAAEAIAQEILRIA